MGHSEVGTNWLLVVAHSLVTCRLFYYVTSILYIVKARRTNMVELLQYLVEEQGGRGHGGFHWLKLYMNGPLFSLLRGERSSNASFHNIRQILHDIVYRLESNPPPLMWVCSSYVAFPAYY